MKYLFTIAAAVCLIQTVHAQWITDTMTRNPICTAKNNQNEQQLCSDGNKGAYIVWEDYRSNHSGIFGQLIDSGGNIQWQTNGILFTDTSSSGCVNPRIVADGKGGATVAWEVSGAGDNIRARHINKAGNSTWQIPIDTINDDRFLHAIPDGHGGTILNWYSYIYGTGDPIVVQWVDSTGKAYLPLNGLQISDPTGAHYSSDIATDNHYHTFIVYYDYDTLRVQKIDSMGNFLWGKRGIVLTTAYYDDGSGLTHKAISDGNGGVIIGWNDTRHNPLKAGLFAQRLDSNGNLLWGSNALLVDSATNIYSHSFISIGTDENHGVFFCFGYGNLFVQHVGVKGNVSWGAAESVTLTKYGQNYSSMDDDGYNGAVITWDDGRGVYGQDIDTTGKRQWGATDAPVYTGSLGGSSTGTQTISLKNHKAISAISNGGVDIFAARIPDKSYTTTGIQALVNNNQLSVFPNPTSGNLFVENKSASLTNQLVQLYNLLGQLVYQQTINLPSSSMQEIPLSTTVKGIYFLKISGSGNENIFKLIID